MASSDNVSALPIVLLSLGAVALALGACSSDPAAPADATPDAEVDGGTTAREDATTTDTGTVATDGGGELDGGDDRPDAGGGLDAMPADVPDPFGFGRRLVSDMDGLPEVFAVTPDEGTLLFLQDGRLKSVKATGGGILDHGTAPFSLLPGPATTLFWTTSAPAPTDPESPQSFTLSAFRQDDPMGVDLVEILQGVLRGQAWVGPDGESVIVAANLGMAGPEPSLTADLIMVRADGTAPVPLISAVHMGYWDSSTTTFVGDCQLGVTFATATTAFVSACRDAERGPLDQRALLLVDLVSGDVEQIADDVSPLSLLTEDGTALIYVDNDQQIWGVDAMGASNPIALDDSGAVVNLVVLDGARFAYQTNARNLSVAEYPAMTPTVVAPQVSRLIAVAQTKTDFLYATVVRPDGLMDLWWASTVGGAGAPVRVSSNAMVRPGEEPFSRDGEWVYWYTNPRDLSGTLTARKRDGSMAMHGRGIYQQRNYSDRTGILLWSGATQVGGGASEHITADLAIRKRSAQGPLSTLLTNMDMGDGVRPTFLFSRTRSRIFYRLRDGSSSTRGLYMRELPDAL